MSPRRHTWILLGCLAVLVLLVAAPLGYLMYLQASYDRVVAAYEAAGEPMTPEAFGQAPVPDDQNVAIGLIQLNQTGSLPSIEELDAVLARPFIRWPERYVDSEAMSWWHNLHNLANSLKTDAIFAARRRDAPRFVARLRQLDQVGAAIATDNPWHGAMVGEAVRTLVPVTLMRHDCPLTDDPSRSLIDLLLADSAARQRIIRTAQIERLLIHQQLLAGHPPGSGPLNRISQKIMLGHGPAALQQVDLLRDLLLAGSAADADQLLADILSRPATPTGFGQSFFENRLRQHRVDQTERRLAAVLLAARLYHADHGRAPDQLTDLLPYGLPHIPIDPFDPADKPFRYDRARGLVYSVAANRTDEDGNIAADPLKVWSAPDRGISIAPATPPSPLSPR